MSQFVIPPKANNMGGTYSFNYGKIRYHVEVNNNIVEFQVFDMDERFRGTDSEVKEFKASNGILVCSNSYTYLDLKYISLRGRDKTRDKDCAYIKFASNQDAVNYINEVQDALSDWAYNWEGWNKPPQFGIKGVVDEGEELLDNSFNGWNEAARNSLHGDNVSNLMDTDGIEDLREVVKKKDDKIKELEEQIEILQRYLKEYNEQNEQLKDYIKNKPNKLDIY